MTEVEEMATLIIRTWHDSYSDNGAIWRKSQDELDRAKANASDEVYRQALNLAYGAWPAGR